MDSVEEIRQRLSASEVISTYVQLKLAGRNQKGLCPFHHEKTPSLMVSDEKGIWHCFGCGEGGDIFGFVMKMEGLDFRGALELLASRAGVTLETSASGQQNRKLKDRLAAVNELATRYYQAVLAQSPAAQKYLAKRGFTAATIKAWRIGYAPNQTASMATALKGRGVTDQELAKAGLTRQASTASKPQDLFRSRLMIPLIDAQNRVVGFTARVIGEGMPKYLNTPQTVLFDKSRYLYGLHQAKEAVRQADQAVLVEGHLDVLASHQAKVQTVLATGGTALTLTHLKLLTRLTKNIKLAFDQDAAGITATERAIPIAQAASASLYMVQVTGAKDPDELLRQPDGLKRWQAAIEQAPYVMDWLLAVLPKQYDLSLAVDKRRLTDRVMGTLAKLTDAVEQDHYVQVLAKLVQVEPAAIRRKLAGQTEASPTRRHIAPAYQASPRSAGMAVEEALLSLVISFPDTRTALQELTDEHFSSSERVELVKYLRRHPDTVFHPEAENLPAALLNQQNYVKIWLLQGEEGYEDWAPLDRRIEAFGLAARLQNIYTRKLRAQINEELKQAEASGDAKRKLELLRQFRDLAQKSS
ncbi:DNA primase [Candidatus Microgenomates bacterium]|nr:DNA primase [Candidatus Microgenomates bacterium]